MSKIGSQRLAEKRLSDQDKRLNIYRKYKAGAKVKDLAREYGYKNSSGISNILNRVESSLADMAKL